MSEYIYSSKGEPLANERGEISLPRCKIVRCMDCRFSIADGFGCGKGSDFENVNPNGFCAWGERRVVE